MTIERMKKQKEETYRKILDNAWDIAISSGLESVSIRKIAAAMHFAPNNLYNYFKDKNDLIQCLKKDAYQWTFDVFSNYKMGDESVRSFMRRVSIDLLHIAEKEPKRYIVMTSDSILDLSDSMDKQVTKHVSSILDKGFANGEFRELDTEITAINMRIMIIGFVRMICVNHQISPEEADKMLNNLLDIIFEGVKK